MIVKQILSFEVILWILIDGISGGRSRSTLLMTYRYIETTLGISGTSIHSIVHEHLTAKKIFLRWIAHNLLIAQKKVRFDWDFWALKTSILWVIRHIVLPPNDFFLFLYVENKMRGQRFSTFEEAVAAFSMDVLEIPQSEWQKCFDNCFKRMQKCLDFNGEYFEKQ